jgi:hypothetical protein
VINKISEMLFDQIPKKMSVQLYEERESEILMVAEGVSPKNKSIMQQQLI